MDAHIPPLPSHHGVDADPPPAAGRGPLGLLLRRGSVRNFADRPIDGATRDALLGALAHTASGGNLQPFSVIAIEDPAVRARLAELCEGQPWVAAAPLDLLVCLDWRRNRRAAGLSRAPFTAHRSFRHFWIAFQDATIAAQTLCAAADALGLGSVLVGTVIEAFRELRDLLGLPDLVVPVVLVCVGHPTAPPHPPRKFGVELLVHEGRYRDPSDEELLAALEAKYPGVRIEPAPERLERLAAACRAAGGDELAAACLDLVRARGHIDAIQRLFGLHYAADGMASGNERFVALLGEFGLDPFTPFAPCAPPRDGAEATPRPDPPAVRFIPCDPVAEREALVAFLGSDRWEFFGTPLIAGEKANAWIDEGFFASDEAESHWILGPAGERIGHIRIFDLLDPSPLFDLRILSAHRGRGIGLAAVRWIVDRLFARKPGLRRVEAQTRRDNLAMRRVLCRAGFVKEAHYREAWPAADGTLHDGVGYAILRRDRERGGVTPPPFDDEGGA